MGFIDEHIEKELTLRRQEADGTKRAKTIYPVPDDQLGEYRSLGRAVGESYGLAVYEAVLHCEHFFDRVAGYRLVHGSELDMMERVTGRSFVSIEFYESRHARD